MLAEYSSIEEIKESKQKIIDRFKIIENSTRFAIDLFENQPQEVSTEKAKIMNSDGVDFFPALFQDDPVQVSLEKPTTT